MNYLEDSGHTNVRPFCRKIVIVTGPVANKKDMDSILTKGGYSKWFERADCVDDPCSPFAVSGVSRDVPMSPTDSPGNGANTTPAAMPRRARQVTIPMRRAQFQSSPRLPTKFSGSRLARLSHYTSVARRLNLIYWYIKGERMTTASTPKGANADSEDPQFRANPPVGQGAGVSRIRINIAGSTDASRFSSEGTHSPSAGDAQDPAAGVELILAKVSDWSSFDVFQLDALSAGRPLQLITTRILTSLGLVQRLQLNVAQLSAFLGKAEAHYLPQPYHNNTHAADVVQALGSMMAADSWSEALDDWELLAMVIAAAVHDLGHPGVNNDFHMRTNSEAAQTYHDIGSINENSHAALALELLNSEEYNFVRQLDAEKAASFQELVKDMVLHTDMAHHAGVIKSFKTSLQQFGPSLHDWPSTDRRRAFRMLLHCADISNPARPLAHCTTWGHRVQEELYKQGDRERELGLALTPACDRRNGCPSRSQAAFIKHIMQPTIAALEPMAPNFVALVTPHIACSLRHWEEVAAAVVNDLSPTKVPAMATDRVSSADVIHYLAP